MLIFVYGTLMKGYGNHRVMEQAHGKFVGRAKMFGKEMYYAGGVGSFPAVINGKGTIYGEVYKIPEEVELINYYTGKREKVKAISVLDGLEGYNPNNPQAYNMYLRKKARVILQNGKQVWVSYYFWNRRVDPKLQIKTGDYRKGK